MTRTSLKVGRRKIAFFSTWKVIPYSQVSCIWINSDRKLFNTLNVCKNGCRFEICPFNKRLQNSIVTKIILPGGSKSVSLDPALPFVRFCRKKWKKAYLSEFWHKLSVWNNSLQNIQHIIKRHMNCVACKAKCGPCRYN